MVPGLTRTADLLVRSWEVCCTSLKQDVPLLNRPTVHRLAKALNEAGIRPSQRHRRVGDYELKELAEGPDHAFPGLARRARLAQERHPPHPHLRHLPPARRRSPRSGLADA